MEDSVVETITDLNRICRTCLNQKSLDDLRSLSENSLDEMLNGLASVKVSNDLTDGFFLLILLKYKFNIIVS